MKLQRELAISSIPKCYPLRDEQAFGFGDFINKLLKKAKKSQASMRRFVPAARLVDDGLFRFGQGFSPWSYPETPEGHFPNP